jgi:hypothetical protein
VSTPPVRLASSCAVASLALALAAACVPSGSAPPYDAGSSNPDKPAATAFRPSTNVMTQPFFDNFDRPGAPSGSASAMPSGRPSAAPAPSAAPSASASPSASAAASAAASGSSAPQAPDLLGPDWSQAGTNVWHIEDGRLCGQGAKNHGVWLTKTLPINARIEFDAVSYAQDGDLKAEVWGDGRSAATSVSYTNATSYLTIFGGWSNKFHVLARINEHGTDRKQISIDPTSDDPKEKPVVQGQIYHFKVERTDGKTVHWYVDGIEYLSFSDSQPLTGAGHDHFGFNDWNVKVCFDNVRVTPLP